MGLIFCCCEFLRRLLLLVFLAKVVKGSGFCGTFGTALSLKCFPFFAEGIPGERAVSGDGSGGKAAKISMGWVSTASPAGIDLAPAGAAQ